MSMREKAVYNFSVENYNCAEAIFLAANEGCSPETLKAIGSFGAGLGSGNNCGALAGAAATISMRKAGAKAHDTPEVRVFIKEFVSIFNKKFGGIDCSVLKPIFFVEGKRCERLVAETAELLEEYLKAI